MAKFGKRKFHRGPLPFQYVFLITFICFAFSTAAGLWLINKGITPTLIQFAEAKTNEVGTLVINKAINKKIANVMDVNDIMVEYGDGGFGYNTEVINRIQTEITDYAQSSLNEAEKGRLENLQSLTDVEINEGESQKEDGIVYEVPLGQATNNALLANLGPKVPVRFNMIGYVSSNIKEEVKPWGINNAMVKVYIHLEVNVQTIVPFATKSGTIQQDVLVAMGVVKGDVPQFFNSGGDSSPSIELPTQ